MTAVKSGTVFVRGQVQLVLMVAASSLKISTCDLDLGLGHTAYCCASLIQLYLHIKFN